MTAAADAFETFVKGSRHILTVPGARPEVSLYGVTGDLLRSFADRLGTGNVEIIPQTSSDEGVPDYRLQRNGELLGWVELKAVVGKDLNRLTGHDKNQTARFVAGLSNVVITNGWQWQLYQDGRRASRALTIGPEDMFDPSVLEFPVPAPALESLDDLLRTFLGHHPAQYRTPQAAVKALAVRAKALKLALLEVDQAGAGPTLTQLFEDFRSLLFRHGTPFTWPKFVDTYVQVATFGLLLWRLETRTEIALDRQVALHGNGHPLLQQCLSILWSPASRLPILVPLLENLAQTVNLIEPALFEPRRRTSGQVPDPIVHAYEPFFRAYDRAASESNGVYYTPVEVVRQIVDGVHYLLRTTFRFANGVIDERARFLDPATGTGTFLLGLADKVGEVASSLGLPADIEVERVMTTQTAAFELFPGPYAIAHQRLEAALTALGAPPTGRLPILLTDTLAAPTSTTTAQMSGFGVMGAEIVRERQRADELKVDEQLLVVLGNPPWERLAASVRSLEPFAEGLREVLRENTPAAARPDLRSTRDLYVAFWLWALWALQPPAQRIASVQPPAIDTTNARGLVAFITNRTWLHGRSLIGLRSLIRAGASEVWIYDLGGDARGSHGARSFAGGDANVFEIQTGAAIAWVVFGGHDDGSGCTVRYRRRYGSRSDKLSALVEPFDPNAFDIVERVGGETMLPDRWGRDALRRAPRIGDLFADAPLTGFQTARDSTYYSPVQVDKDRVLAEHLETEGRAGQRRAARVATGVLAEWAGLRPTDRVTAWQTAQQIRTRTPAPSPETLSTAKLRLVMYRPLDFRWLYDDPAWVTWYREDLHAVYADEDPVPTLVTIEDNHGRGPAVVHTNRIMEQHAFRGSAGGKAIYPLWRPSEWSGESLLDDSRIRQTGFSPLVTQWLAEVGRSRQYEQAYDYILSVLSAPAYTVENWEALTAEPLHVPLTRDARLFERAVALGSEVRAAWDCRVTPDPSIAWRGNASQEPLGAVEAAGGVLKFANGRELAGVSPAAWAYEVSGYRVLEEWFRARAHWRLDSPRAQEARVTVAAVMRLNELGPALDATYHRVLAST